MTYTNEEIKSIGLEHKLITDDSELNGFIEGFKSAMLLSKWSKNVDRNVGLDEPKDGDECPYCNSKKIGNTWVEHIPDWDKKQSFTKYGAYDPMNPNHVKVSLSDVVEGDVFIGQDGLCDIISEVSTSWNDVSKTSTIKLNYKYGTSHTIKGDSKLIGLVKV